MEMETEMEMEMESEMEIGNCRQNALGHSLVQQLYMYIGRVATAVVVASLCAFWDQYPGASRRLSLLNQHEVAESGSTTQPEPVRLAIKPSNGAKVQQLI